MVIRSFKEPVPKPYVEKDFSVNSKLPPLPNFAEIEATSKQAAEERTKIVSIIGNIVFSWSNNESMFIYFLMILMKSDFPTAAVTFISLNTTRARLDLIRRLTKAKVSDAAVIRKVDRLIERFNACTRVRNEFNHCIYELNEKGQFTYTNALRITEKKTGIEFVERKAFDDKRIQEMMRTIRKLETLNRDLWSFLPVFEKAVQAGAKVTAKTKRS